MQKALEHFPVGSSITFDDVYRFCGNNYIGRREYQPYIDANNDAGTCLVGLVTDFSLEDRYIPANLYIACQKYGLKYPEYNATVELMAKDIAAKQRNGFSSEGDAIIFWTFCINNSFELFNLIFEETDNDLS